MVKESVKPAEIVGEAVTVDGDAVPGYFNIFPLDGIGSRVTR